MPILVPGTPRWPGVMAGTYLGCWARGHLEPLIVTSQLLPAEMLVPPRDRRVPPPWGPKLGCRELTWGSWAETGAAGRAVNQCPHPNERPARATPGLAPLLARGHYHEEEAAEGGRALNAEARGLAGLHHAEHHVGRPCHRRPPRLQGTHQHVHEVLEAGGGLRPAGRQGISGGTGRGAQTSPPTLPSPGPALVQQHAAASPSHRHPVGAGGAAVCGGVQRGAEGHAAERQPRPAPQRCALGVELQDGQREHAMATGSSLLVGTVPGLRRGGPTAHRPVFCLPPHPPWPDSRRSPRGQGHRRGPTWVRMGRQLSRTQVPLHSWLRVHPSPHQPQPMKRSARRQRSQVKKWRQPGPVTFTRHTWGHRMEVSRRCGGAGPMSHPGPPPAHLGAGGEEQ